MQYQCFKCVTTILYTYCVNDLGNSLKNFIIILWGCLNKVKVFQ